MKKSQLAAQLYTVRAHTTTATDLAATFKKVRAIGYPAVQISGVGPIKAEEVARMLADTGLTCCATHEGGDAILNEPQRVVERLHALGCRITAYPYPGGITFDSVDDVKRLAARLNAAGKVLHDAGCVLLYHNHQIEFRRLGGKTILERLYEETDPRYLQGEPDTYWVQFGGGDPVDWCRRLPQRLPVLHLKDYMIMPDSSPLMTEIGNGNLNWHGIIAAADAAGCQWYCVEQDTCPGDPFDSLRISYEYLVKTHCAV